MKNGGTRSMIMKVLIVALLSVTAGCGQLSKEQQQTRQQSLANREQQNADRSISEQYNGKTMNVGDGSTIHMTGSEEILTIPLKTVDGVSYVIGSELASAIGFHHKWNESSNTFMIGDNDAAYELQAGSTTAQRGDSKVQLPQPPILRNSQFHIPVSALGNLLADDVRFEVQGQSMIVRATGETVPESMDGPDEANTGAELDFADDPNDPYKGTGAKATLGQVEDGDTLSAERMEPEAVPVLKNINMDTLIAQAKRYLGVKYEFGAEPYPKSGKFDCSSFTQYVFGKSGIQLKRTARDQGNQGEPVSRKNLRKGDLMFFYVPGRFKSNKTIGHVSIYMGDQQMIHASPSQNNGVQITNINKAYWKKTFLKAKRVAL